jgi:hypothetical protein
VLQFWRDSGYRLKRMTNGLLPHRLDQSARYPIFDALRFALAGWSWGTLAGRKKRVDLTPSKRMGTAIFLLWLLLVNVIYYEQFIELAVSHLRWLSKLWH